MEFALIAPVHQENKKVTIAIPVFNRKDMVEETINSALSQTYKNIEIIVVDNASDDGTWEFLKRKYSSEPLITLHRNNKNVGPVKNWLRCLELAGGFYTKLLFSDDVMAPNFIELCVKSFDPEAAFVFAPALVGASEDTAVKRFTFCSSKISSSYFLNYLLFFPMSLVSPSAALFRTNDLLSAFVSELPGFHNRGFFYFGAGPDLLLFLLTLTKYKHVRYEGRTKVFFREHPGSATTSAISTQSWPIRECYNKTRAWFLANHGCCLNKHKLSGRIIATELIEKKRIIGKSELKSRFYGLSANYLKSLFYCFLFIFYALKIRGFFKK